MQIQISVGLVALIITILVHGVFMVWWAASISGSVKHLHDCFHATFMRVDKEMEKRDQAITAIWKRIDELRDMIDGTSKP